MSEYSGADRREPVAQGWHLKKEVNLTLIISVIVIAVSVVTGYTDLRKDIELIKADNAGLHQKSAQSNVDVREAFSLLRVQVEKVEGKLDRLIERRQP